MKLALVRTIVYIERLETLRPHLDKATSRLVKIHNQVDDLKDQDCQSVCRDRHSMPVDAQSVADHNASQNYRHKKNRQYQRWDSSLKSRLASARCIRYLVNDSTNFAVRRFQLTCESSEALSIVTSMGRCSERFVCCRGA